MAKKKTSNETPADAQAPPFEDALTELQQIVADLEDGSLGLEEALARFESGMKLLRTCHQVLEQAERRIAIVTGVDADGNPVTAPFDGSATYDSGTAEPSEKSASTAGRRRRSTSEKRPPREERTGDERESPRDDDADDDRTLFQRVD